MYIFIFPFRHWEGHCGVLSRRRSGSDLRGVASGKAFLEQMGHKREIDIQSSYSAGHSSNIMPVVKGLKRSGLCCFVTSSCPEPPKCSPHPITALFTWPLAQDLDFPRTQQLVNHRAQQGASTPFSLTVAPPTLAGAVCF